MKSGSFESERLQFREICAADAEEIVSWRSNPIVYKYFSNPKPLILKEHLVWYESIYLNDPTRIDFVVTEKKNMIPIGLAGVSSLGENSCEIGYTIGEPSFQGKGFGTESINAVVNEFMKKGITTFFATIHRDNIASIKAAEKSGFIFDNHVITDFIRYRLLIM